MVTDQQVKHLFKLVFRHDKPVAAAAAKAGMSESTARKYLRLAELPSEVKPLHTWRTRSDPFAAVWEEAKAYMLGNPEKNVKMVFGVLQRRYPRKFQPGQLRTLQRRVKKWRETGMDC